MASEGTTQEAAHTYEGFVSLMKWGTIATVVVTAIVVLLIAG